MYLKAKPEQNSEQSQSKVRARAKDFLQFVSSTGSAVIEFSMHLHYLYLHCLHYYIKYNIPK